MTGFLSWLHKATPHANRGSSDNPVDDAADAERSCWEVKGSRRISRATPLPPLQRSAAVRATDRRCLSASVWLFRGLCGRLYDYAACPAGTAACSQSSRASSR